MSIDELKENILIELARCKGRASLFLEMEGQIIEFNSNEIYQSASLIKLPIMFETLRQIEKGMIMPDQPIILSDKHKVGNTGVLQAMPGEKMYTILDLVTLMIIVSDNSATNLLIDLVGMDSINEGISILCMHDTILERKMLDFAAITSRKDNFTTAADIVACLKEGTEGTLLSNTSKTIFLNILFQQQFKDKLPAYFLEEKISSGNKTGELPGIEHDCAVIDYGNSRAFASVLIDGLNEPEHGRTTIRQIGKLLNSYLTGIST
jgi:beta-lactamase class A